jgi:hypothetical protein
MIYRYHSSAIYSVEHLVIAVQSKLPKRKTLDSRDLNYVKRVSEQ